MRFLLLFSVLFCQPLLAQMPEGYFHREGNPSFEQFYFGKDHSFSYLYDCGDCGSQSGSGKYTVVHDTLELHFQPSCKIEPVHVLDDFFEKEFPEQDSIFYSVSFAPDSNLQWMLVQLCTGNGTNIRNFEVKNGHCNFYVKKSEADSCFLHISTFNYNEEWVALKEMPKRVKITLVNTVHYGIPPWVVYKFKIVRKNRRQIVLISLEGTSYNGEGRSFSYRNGKRR